MVGVQIVNIYNAFAKLLQQFVRQEGELININSGVFALKTSKASQAVSRALVIQLLLKLCSTQGP